MQIGIFAALGNPFATPAYRNALGPAAEERGFHSIWVAEHVVLFDRYASKYPYAADGKIPAGGESDAALRRVADLGQVVFLVVAGDRDGLLARLDALAKTIVEPARSL